MAHMIACSMHLDLGQFGLRLAAESLDLPV